VLGAILLNNDIFNLAVEVVDAPDFFRDAHRRIFEKMVQLSNRGNAIDLVTLKEELGRSGELDEVGGPAYITALVDGVPRSTNVQHYARIIKEKATLRRLISSANKILTTPTKGRTRPTRSWTRRSTRSSRSPTTRSATASFRFATSPTPASTPSRSCTRARS
jgi:replicative DNA helicase